jgi:hypothetical protein
MSKKPTLLEGAISAIKADKPLNFAEWNKPEKPTDLSHIQGLRGGKGKSESRLIRPRLGAGKI